MNIPALFATPVSAGLCQYGDIYRLSLDDFLNMNEILLVKSENERRLYEHERAKNGNNSR